MHSIPWIPKFAKHLLDIKRLLIPGNENKTLVINSTGDGLDTSCTVVDIPEPSISDNDKVLTVDAGAAVWAEPVKEIYKGAMPPDNPSDGDLWIDESVSNFISVDTNALLFSSGVPITKYGAVPGARVDQSTKIQLAIDEANERGVAVIATDGEFWLNNGLTLYDGTKIISPTNNTTFNYENKTSGYFMSASGGLEGDEIEISGTLTYGDDSLTTKTAHGASVEDYYLLVSQRNALCPDAGDWQLGLATGSLTHTYFAEPLNIKRIDSPTSLHFNGSLVFPNYFDNDDAETKTPIDGNTGLPVEYTCIATKGSYTVTMSDAWTTDDLMVSMRVNGNFFENTAKIKEIVDNKTFLITEIALDSGPVVTTFTAYPRPSSTIQKINFVKNIIIDGIKFKAGSGNNTINIEWGKDCEVRNCSFDMFRNVGYGVSYKYSYNCKGENSTVTYAANSPSENTDVDISLTHDPAYNPFKLVSSWSCGFNRCKAYNASQPFDITWGNGYYPSIHSYVTNCETYNSKGNGMTSHSGNYGTYIDTNQFIGCDHGPALRSRNAVFTNNIITRGRLIGGESSSQYGLGLTDGFIVDSKISNNIIDGFKFGIKILNRISQGTGFTKRNTDIFDNIIIRCKYGIETDYDTIYNKTGTQSGLRIKRNKIIDPVNYGIRIYSYLNGVDISDNEIIGPMSQSGTPYGIYFVDNCVDSIVENNRFINLGANAIAIKGSAITDRVTFTIEDYPTNRFTYNNNKVFGPISAFSSASIAANKYEHGIIKSSRTWTPNSTTSFLHETGGTGLTWSQCTSTEGSCYISFGDTDSQYQGGLYYANSTDKLYLRAGGSFRAWLESVGLNPYYDSDSETPLNLGSATYGWNRLYIKDIILDKGPSVNTGAGSPEGVLSAVKGSTYHRTDGGAGTSFYVKESGTGNTGWVPK